jgi:hypothetical protein
VDYRSYDTSIPERHSRMDVSSAIAAAADDDPLLSRQFL